MDTRGHLIDMQQMDPEEAMQKLYEGYELVPDHLAEQARLELMGKKETFVGMKATGSMSKHARHLLKKKLKREKTARRKNRCHQ